MSKSSAARKAHDSIALPSQSSSISRRTSLPTSKSSKTSQSSGSGENLTKNPSTLTKGSSGSLPKITSSTGSISGTNPTGTSTDNLKNERVPSLPSLAASKSVTQPPERKTTNRNEIARYQAGIKKAGATKSKDGKDKGLGVRGSHLENKPAVVPAPHSRAVGKVAEGSKGRKTKSQQDL
ncbi:hypothetical protein HK097_001104, partial [Rhizophlyctis rosea]